MGAGASVGASWDDGSGVGPHVFEYTFQLDGAVHTVAVDTRTSDGGQWRVMFNKVLLAPQPSTGGKTRRRARDVEQEEDEGVGRGISFLLPNESSHVLYVFETPAKPGYPVLRIDDRVREEWSRRRGGGGGG
jgi:hypothetical protein